MSRGRVYLDYIRDMLDSTEKALEFVRVMLSFAFCLSADFC